MAGVKLTQALCRAERIRPDGYALIDGAQRWTWREMCGRVRQLAGALSALGVMPGDRVAMLSLNSHRYVEYYLATVWAGAVIMPLNHRLTANDLSALVEDGEPCLLIVSPEFIEVGRAIKALSPSINHLVLANTDAPADMLAYETILGSADPIEDRAEGGDALACLFYTGGTTGQPKGVMLSHTNIFMNSLNLIPEVAMDERTVHLHAGPLFHVAAGVRIYSVSQVAGTHVVAPRFVLPDILNVIDGAKVTLATFVPTMLHHIIEDDTLAGYSLPSLQCITYGAAPMPRDLLMRAMQRFAHVRFVQSYGMTETSPIVTILGARHHAAASRLGSAGLPALSAEVRIGSPGAPSTEGEPGEIMVRGPMVMRGYWRNPAATAAAFDDGWLRTGDIGHFDEQGFLFVVDRIKDVIISGGENVYSTEVEQVLADHPSIAECAVFGMPNKRWGERVHAVVVPRPGRLVDEQELILHCRGRIAGYKLPRSIEIRREPLPTSSVNKILKSTLRAEALARLQTEHLGESA